MSLQAACWLAIVALFVTTALLILDEERDRAKRERDTARRERSAR